MIIRKFKAEDLNGVLEIESNTFKERNSSIHDILYEIDAYEFLVAIDKNNIIGYVIGYNFSENEGQISSIAVKHEYRNKRIGVRLLHRILCIFHRNSLKCVYLEVRISNKKAQRIYGQAGFELYRIKKGHYLDGEIGIFMRKRFYGFSHQNISCKKINAYGYISNECNDDIYTRYMPIRKDEKYI
ncbi:MAG: GNAT family N-acetyltransferase [Methanosarcinaceae archaeon]|nr:GNAT family N-acetyltransferase [Methanosarcinaceae archaeon]